MGVYRSNDRMAEPCKHQIYSLKVRQSIQKEPVNTEVASEILWVQKCYNQTYIKPLGCLGEKHT